MRQTSTQVLNRTRARKLIWQVMDKYKISLAAASHMVLQRLARDPEWELLTDNIKAGVAHMRGKNPKGQWYAFATMKHSGKWNVKHFQVKEFSAGDPKKARGFTDVRGPFATRAKAEAAKEKLKKVELKWKKSKTYQQRKKKFGLDDYEVNPHLRSGKWQFVGMFEKRDIKQVKRILRVHGMKTKVTKDHYKREPGMRELYVERGAFQTAYRAIAALFVSEKSMAA